MIQQMTLDDRKIFPDIFHPVSLPTEEPLWVLFDWSAISLDIQLRSVPYFTTNNYNWKIDWAVYSAVEWERERDSAQRGHHEPAEPRKRKKEGRKATSQKQNNLRIFNGSNISNISSISNRYSGCIGSQMLLSGAKVSIL